MAYALFFLLGLLTDRWLEEKLTRLAVKSPWEPIRGLGRSVAASRGFDTQERGKVLKLDAYEAVEAARRPGNVLDNL